MLRFSKSTLLHGLCLVNYRCEGYVAILRNSKKTNCRTTSTTNFGLYTRTTNSIASILEC
jgi:hypothetical protein